MNRATFELQHPGRFFLEVENRPELALYLRRIDVLESGETILAAASAGEGNMNRTVRVTTPKRTFIVKQSRPWVEKYPQFAAPWDRALVEAAFYRLIANQSAVCSRMPQLLALDSEARVLVLEDLGTGADYTSLYGGEVLAESDLDALTDFLSGLHALFTERPAPTPLPNREMRELNSQHIFFLPLDAKRAPPLDSIQPGLGELAAPRQADDRLRAEVHRLGREVYLVDGPTLVHGDFFPGSFLRSPGGPKVIDPEFGYFGRAEFDGAVLLAHLILGRQAPVLSDRFLGRYEAPAGFEMPVLLQLAGVEIIRRLIGYAQLPLVCDLATKARWLALARNLVLHPDRRWLTVT